MQKILIILVFCLFCKVHSTEELLNVHVVVHSHDDVGWLHTVDQYYQRAVEFILDGVTAQLEQDVNRKFIFVETAFFARWWKQQTEEKHEKVKRLVENGQLEFISGGWSMVDEAGTNYRGIIDDMTRGHLYLMKLFGEYGKPKVGWHIDPFGHSSGVASLFQQIGFDSWFFARMDYQDFSYRMGNKSLEWIWQPSEVNGDRIRIFTGMLSTNDYDIKLVRPSYGPPPGFAFEWDIDGSPAIQDDLRLHDYNVDKRAEQFAKQCKYQAQYYRTNNIILTMGTDFTATAPARWYTNLDKLFRYLDNHPELGIKAFYSTPSIYTKAKYDRNIKWPIKTDDLFPYLDDEKSAWTGYFTSRPAHKYYTLLMNAFVNANWQLDVITERKVVNGSYDDLDEAVTVCLHHDAITGTEKQHVANDYAMRLYEGYEKAEAKFTKMIEILMLDSIDLSLCPHLNESECNVTVSETGNWIGITIYNQLAHPRTELVQIPIDIIEGIQLVDSNFRDVGFEANSLTSFDTSQLPWTHPGAYSLNFVANLPPLGFETYFLKLEKNSLPSINEDKAISNYDVVDEKPNNEDEAISNEFYTVRISSETGLLKSIDNHDDGLITECFQDYLYYWGFPGTSEDNQASGAYIFRPNGTGAYRVNPSKVSYTVRSGSIVQEIRQTFSSWLTQTIRLTKGIPMIEFSYTIGPIPKNDDIGKEVISRFSCNIMSNSLFYTDYNGLEMIERKIDYRPSWPLHVVQPVAGNYYPINSALYIQDEEHIGQRRLTILVDRPVGGASLPAPAYESNVELMLHRRLLYDDRRGVGEPLDEGGVDGNGLVIRGHMVVLFGSPKNSKQRIYEPYLLSPLFPVFSRLEGTPQDFGSSHRTKYSSIKDSLPLNIELVTLMPYDGKTLIRFINTDQNDVKGTWIDLQNMFSKDIIDYHETLLTTMKKAEDFTPLKWEIEDSRYSSKQSLPQEIEASCSTSSCILLKPFQIKTYLVSFEVVDKSSTWIYIVAAIGVLIVCAGVIGFFFYKRNQARRGDDTQSLYVGVESHQVYH